MCSLFPRLHVVNTPLIAFKALALSLVLALEEFLLEAISSICKHPMISFNVSEAEEKEQYAPTPSHLYPGLIPNLFGGGVGPVYSGFRGPFCLFFCRKIALSITIEDIRAQQIYR